MKIRIEYEVPDDDCVSCGKSFWNATHRSLYCKEFTSVYLKRAINGKFNRCQACIDAEVKVQPE